MTALRNFPDAPMARLQAQPFEPRGSRYAALVFLALWRSLAAIGRSAGRRRPHPAEEARQVRELARSYRDTDPGFAADLLAAADRHELLHGV
jgi:hypothetical protein